MRTLTQDADRVTKARSASGHPGTATLLGRRTVLLWAARAALGNDDGSAMATLPARPQRLGGCSVAPPAATRRLGALLSSDECRVERRANGEASSVMAMGGQAGLCCLVGALDGVQLWVQLVVRLSVL
jgi:hypothetical protein